MKKIIIVTALAISSWVCAMAQQPGEKLQAAVQQLDKATTVADYEKLATAFLAIAKTETTQWLPYYYAAFCNAKIGWLNENDPDNIEAYADAAEEQIGKARSLIDSTTGQKEMSELFCVYSMLNRARVYINPAGYGPKYGPLASRYTMAAREKDPDNPRALYLEGWEKFATPKLYGGDKDKARELLTLASQKLNSAAVNSANPHWGKAEVDGLLKKL